jgi:hypothetical protein
MAGRFVLPHIDISALRTASDYSGVSSGGSSAPRIRAEHGKKLIAELKAALFAIDESRSDDPRLDTPKGGYIEVELRGKPDPSAILELKRPGIRPGAVNETATGRTVAVYVPDQAREAFAEIFSEYLSGPLTAKAQNPPNATRVEAIEEFRKARLSTFWTDDPLALPIESQHQMWWAVWVHSGNEAELEEVCNRLSLRLAGRDRRLYFPEAAVIPVFASRAAIELLTFATGIIAELRRASDTPVFFVDTVRHTQHEWSDDLAQRIVWPGSNVPSVCVLDTGVNRGHSLLEPALATVDQHAIDAAWQVSDHHVAGHGTGMAGLALHGDLTARLGDLSTITLRHRLESVKLLPPGGFDDTEPSSYGAITQAAIALPEISAPDRTRVFCMAVTNEDVSGARPSTWSAAIDQAASATMIADDEDTPKRLFVLSAGNTVPEVQASRLRHQDEYPAEDPCQAWNALTVGAYTDLVTIADKGYETWSPLAAAGSLSPHSRTATTWPRGRAPIKPEIVLEGGNRALSADRREALTLESLSLLTTGKDVDTLPLATFNATSAATAQAARMAAQITALHPEYWPETVRALMVHSAEWTPPMLAELNSSTGVKGRYDLVRRFGYGVPDIDRAEASAKDHLALFSQSEIQPFRLKGDRKFNECHYYNLPLPNDVLAGLENERVKLKITLSYFIEPNPGFSANVDPQRYQSFGLRFDLRRRGETLPRFQYRVNGAEREGEVQYSTIADEDDWILGPDSISAGSLHCDVWSGPAVNLLGRDILCIKPVNGWWRNRASAEYVNRKTRYSLVVTLKAGRSDIDLYNPIKALVKVPSQEILV